MRRRDVRGSRAPCLRNPGAHRPRSSARRQPGAAGLPRGRVRSPTWSEPARSWTHGTPSRVRRDELHKPHAALLLLGTLHQSGRSSTSSSAIRRGMGHGWSPALRLASDVRRARAHHRRHSRRRGCIAASSRLHPAFTPSTITPYSLRTPTGLGTCSGTSTTVKHASRWGSSSACQSRIRRLGQKGLPHA